MPRRFVIGGLLAALMCGGPGVANANIFEDAVDAIEDTVKHVAPPVKIGPCEIRPERKALRRCANKIFSKTTSKLFEAAGVKRGPIALSDIDACDINIGPSDLNPGHLKDKILACGKAVMKSVIKTLRKSMEKAVDKAFGAVKDKLLPAVTKALTELAADVGDQRDFHKRLLAKLVEHTKRETASILTAALGVHPADIGKKLERVADSLPIIGSKLGDIIKASYGSLYEFLAKRVAQAMLGFLPGILDKLSDKLGLAVVASLKGVVKMISGLSEVMTEVHTQTKEIITCLQEGAGQKAAELTTLLKAVLSNPGKAISGLIKQGFDKVKDKVGGIAERLLALVKSPSALAAFPPAALMSATRIDSAQYKDLMEQGVPGVLLASMRQVSLAIPDFVVETLKETLAGEWPFKCVAPVLTRAYEGQKELFASLTAKLVDGLPKIWKAISPKVQEVFGQALHLVSEVLAKDSLIARVREAVSHTYMRKIGELDQLVTKARTLLATDKDDNLRREVLAQADVFRNENPFMQLSFWAELISGPISELIVKWVPKFLSDGEAMIWQVIHVVYDFTDGLLEYIAEVIPYVSDVSTTPVQIVSKVITVVYRVAKFVLHDVLAKVVGAVLPKILGMVTHVISTVLVNSSATLDDFLTPIRTSRELPFPGPLAVLMSGLQNIYKSLVQPYLGSLPVHFAFVGDLVRSLAGETKCKKAGGAK